ISSQDGLGRSPRGKGLVPQHMDRESLGASASGRTIVKVNGISLHSSHDPEREASQYLSRLHGSSVRGLYILLGPGLNYLARDIRARAPRSRILSIQYSAFYSGREAGDSDSAIYGASADAIRRFLEEQLGENDMASLAVIEWPPSAKAYPDE